jgi:hypothetical protein
MKWADYCVTKLSLAENGLIDNILFFKDLGESLDSEEVEKNRNWMVQQINNGKTFCSIRKNDLGKWNKIGDFGYDGSIFTWFIVPENITRRKTFVSYYHHDDQSYRENFENLFEDLIISKSVEKDDIDSNNSDEYIKQLIQKDYLTDTTVLVVLVGPKTKCRMHVDWEISGAISTRVGGNSGLLGILLPSHPDFGSDKYYAQNLPERLAANVKSGYAILRDWTEDRVKMQQFIEEAFANKSEVDKRITTSIPQMEKDTCE